MTDNKAKNIKNGVIVGICVMIASAFINPIVMPVSNGLTGVFSTPKEVKATNERITRDSTQMAKALEDSCRKFRLALQAQQLQLREIERQLSTVKTKLHIP